MKLNVKLPMKPKFSIRQDQNGVIISIRSICEQQDHDDHDAHDVYTMSYIFNNESMRHKYDQQQNQQAKQIEGLYVYNNLEYKESQNRRQSQNMIVNKKAKKYQGIKSNKIIEVGQKDYAFFINQDRILSGYYNTDFCLLSKRLQYKKKKSAQTVLKTEQKYIFGITKINNTSISIANSRQKHDSFSDNYLVDEFSVFDLCLQSCLWTYSKPRESIIPNPLNLLQSCVLLAHYNFHDNITDLILHDTRSHNAVCLLDTSRDDFGSVTWHPNYTMVYKISPWEVATVWGGPGGKINHIIRLDIRFPLRKQIIVKNIQHPRYFYQSKIDKQSYWVIRNQFNQYRYTQTIIENKEYQNSR